MGTLVTFSISLSHGLLKGMISEAVFAQLFFVFFFFNLGDENCALTAFFFGMRRGGVSAIILIQH